MLAYSTGRLKQRPFALVAQLDRVPGYEPGGRRFESSRVHQIQKTRLLGGFFVSALNGTESLLVKQA